MHTTGRVNLNNSLPGKNSATLDTAAAYCMLRVFLCPNVAQYSVPSPVNDY